MSNNKKRHQWTEAERSKLKKLVGEEKLQPAMISKLPEFETIGYTAIKAQIDKMKKQDKTLKPLPKDRGNS